MVGAGPTGLALALSAHAHGGPGPRRRAPGRAATSRALVVHPRTLEALRPLGVVPGLAARAERDPEVRLHLRSREVAVRVGDLGVADSPFGHPWLLRQHDVEDVLADAVAARGIPVEHGTELVGLAPCGEHAAATLRGPRGTRAVTAAHLAGCDGGEGSVRARAGIGVDEVPYRQEIVLADVELDTGLVPGMAHVAAGWRGVVFVFALGEQATWRVLATCRPGEHAGLPDRAALQRLLDAGGLAARVTEVAWATRLHLSRRLARTYRRGPVLLVGDAAHTHSPAAAQGMNLGLQDALDLGWKLGLAATSTAPERLLDSYTAERRRVARLSGRLTDLVFGAESSRAAPVALLRGVAAPLAAPVLPVLLRRRALVRPAMRLLSGLSVHYRDGPLSHDDGTRGRPRAGGRLPDGDALVAGRRVRVHDLTATPGVHLLLARDAPPLSPEVAGRRVTVHRLENRPGRTVLAVRPDGYVGYRGTGDDPAHTALSGWLDLVGAV